MNCTICGFAQKDNNKIICTRRKNEGVVVIIDNDKTHIPCWARDYEKFNELDFPFDKYMIAPFCIIKED